MGGRKHSSEYHVRHAGCRAPSAGERKMREKVHLLACAQVVFFAVSLVELLPGGFPWPCFCLVVPLGELSLGRVSAGRASRRAWFAPGRYLRKWSRRVCFCRGVPLSSGSGPVGCVSAGSGRAGRASRWLGLESGWVWSLARAIGRWNRPVCRLELAGLRAGSSFVAKKRKL